MMLKEQWLTVTPNRQLLQKILNAKVGTKAKEEDFKSMEAFGTGERNECDRLIEYAEEHNLIIANTLFQKPKNTFWTCESPNKETQNQTEFTSSNQFG